MSESVVRVDLRQATLSESARLREADDASFLALDTPPPVRSLLRVTEGDAVRAFEVGRVVEVMDDSEPTRGCYGEFVDAARLEDQDKVGSEHLQPGISNSGAPAPVVIMNTGEMMLGEVGEDGEAAAEAAAAGGGDASGDRGDSAEADVPSDSHSSSIEDAAQPDDEPERDPS